MRRFLIAIFVFVLVTAVDAQTNAGTKVRVIWGRDKNCHTSNSATVKADGPVCNSVEVNKNRVYYIIFYRGIAYSLNPSFGPNYLRASVQISNNSESSIVIDPATSLVEVYKDEKAFLSGNEIPKTLEPVSAKDIRYPIEFVAGSSATVSGTKPTRETIDKTPATIGRVNIPLNRAGVGRLSDSSIKNELTKASIARSGKVAGFVFFMDERKPAFLVIVMKAGEIEFAFPVPNQ
jgi:hypothetical protein